MAEDLKKEPNSVEFKNNPLKLSAIDSSYSNTKNLTFSFFVEINTNLNGKLLEVFDQKETLEISVECSANIMDESPFEIQLKFKEFSYSFQQKLGTGKNLF